MATSETSGQSAPRDYTRREALGTAAKVALGTAAVAAAGSALALTGCGSDDDETASTIQTLEVSDDAVVTLDAYTQIKDSESYYTIDDLCTIDGQAILFSSDGVTAAALREGASSRIINSVSLMNMDNGSLNEVLSEAVSQGEDYNIYEVRCSSSLLMWVESNYLTAAWRVYAASINGTSIGTANLLDEGDAEYDAPEIAVVGNQGYWIVQPAESGSKTTEDSYLKTSAGVSGGNALITSHGRFCGGLSVNKDIITAMPRSSLSSSVQYEMTAIQNGAIISSLALPRAYRPSGAIYLNGGFSFGIPASYDYGDGISNVGTYYPISSTDWLRLIRQPVTVPGLCNGWLFCKSGARTVLVDTKSRAYFTINQPQDCADYGDYSMQFGQVDSIVNYATLVSDDGSGSKEVLVRRINLVAATA